MDRGFFLTWHAIRSQLAAMPHELYLIRLIHHQTGRPFPGERLWTADQLMRAATIRFLRVRNGEGCDVYIQPYAGNQNAGYILVDLDRAAPMVVEVMRANGHDRVWCCRPALAICKPGFASAPLPWNRRWRPPQASTWRTCTEAIWPARTGVTWDGSPASPIKSRHDAHRTVTRRG